MSLRDYDANYKPYKLIADLMPRYDGNPKLLNYYIREVESLLQLTSEVDRSHPALFCLIKSRLSGPAVDAIAYEGYLNSWDSIKSALIRRLGEPRNEIQVMQELTRVRRSKTEDAESFGKRLRELLDTLYSVGEHGNKSYYEKMVIEQYVNQLDFHVSLGVRIAKPDTFEAAIIAARQEEARLAYNRATYFNNPSTSQAKPKELIKQSTNPHRNTGNPVAQQPNFINQPIAPFMTPQNNFVPQQNNMSPEQRQQWVQSMLPWKNKPASGNFRQNGSGNFRSGNFRNQPNIPKSPVLTPVSSDVTMRTAGKPEKPQFTSQELFYIQSQMNTQDQQGPVDSEYYDVTDNNDLAFEPNMNIDEQEVSHDQDFTQDPSLDNRT